ncbi:MAG: 1,6-anhydro-N-acetylmuramyl-L-alanine amidase AmpD [Spongiibacteraceae bacterium]
MIYSPIPPNDLWLPDIRRVPSPNCNQRPANTPVDLLVIHNISLPAGVFGGSCIEQLFTNCLDCNSHDSFQDLQGLEVSAHFLIRRDGSAVQFVPLNLRAWHAGLSAFCGRENCNDFSVGIELEGTDSCPYTELQYQALAVLTARIMAVCPDISLERIVGHCDIAPQRKTDPGDSFNWNYYRQLLVQV